MHFFSIMESSTLLFIILLIISVNFILEQWLDYINMRRQHAVLPEELKEIYDEEKYAQSIAYQKTQTRFSFLTSTISFIVFFTVVFSGFFGMLDSWLRVFIDNEIGLALAFFGALYFVSDWLSLPFQLYSTFVIEERFGFNKTTPRIFIMDKLKGYLVTLVLGGGVLFVFIWLVLTIGKDFWLYFWIISAVLMVLINMLYTSVIVPIFNKLTPLPEGDLKQAIEAYGQKVGFPIDNIFVIDGSKRSSKANAFFSGIGKRKKIVLYDTLIEGHSKEELVAVLAHEVGHYKKRHILTGMILSIVQVGVMLFILSFLVFNPTLSEAMGASQLSVAINLVVFGILFSPISMITGLLMNGVSRKNEFEADAYASHTYDGTALQTALKKLSVNNLSNLLPHPVYVFFHYSHPPLLQRLRAIEVTKDQ